MNRKVAILLELLANYDDGRLKSFYCIAVNLLDLKDIQNIMLQLNRESKNVSILKERTAIAVRLFQKIANSKSIDLKLRKKNQSYP